MRETAIDPHVFGTTPVVFFNHSFKTLPKSCFVVRHDSKLTGALAAHELLLSEVPHFTYIPSLPDSFWSRDREQGYVDAPALNGKETGMTLRAWRLKHK